MITLKHKSYAVETNNGGVTYKATFQGEQNEFDFLIGFTGKYQTDIAGVIINGYIKRVYVYQEEGPLWNCDVTWGPYVVNGEISGEPLAEYGKKSSQLEGGLLSIPLENHPDFVMCWKYYLAARKGVTDVPDWHETAKEANASDSDYRWVTNPMELPPDGSWHILKYPQMPGVTNYDMATYVIRESVKCRTMNIAGNEVRGKLNRIVSPDYDFGIASKVGGNWKCDSANVNYDGKNWVAHLTYTLSGDEKGWDKRLYK